MHNPNLETNLNQYFPHLWDFIEADAPEPGERPQWYTETGFRLNTRVLISRLLDPDKLIGVRFNKETRYALLDIDSGSPYHPNQDENAISKIRQNLEDIGINDTLLVQSSHSRGIHLYIFLPEVVSTWGLACVLRKKLQQKFIIQDGILEIFPNTKAYSRQGKSLYKAHRLPLQLGSYLLDEDFQPYSNSWERFFELAERCGQWQDMELLKKAITKAKKGFKNRTSRKLETWRKDLLTIIEKGWTACGQTNMILGYISQYAVVFEGIEEEEQLADYIVQKALSLPRIDEFCQHLHELVKRAKEWARCTLNKRFWRKAINYPLDRQGTYQELEEEVRGMGGQGDKEDKGTRGQGDGEIIGEDFSRASHAPALPRLVNPINQRRKLEAKEKIKQAMAHLEKTNSLPTLISHREKALIATAKELAGRGLSKATLYQAENLPLWHPTYREEDQEKTTSSEETRRWGDKEMGRQGGQGDGEIIEEDSSRAPHAPALPTSLKVAVPLSEQSVQTITPNEGFVTGDLDQGDEQADLSSQTPVVLSENTPSRAPGDLALEQSEERHTATQENCVNGGVGKWERVRQLILPLDSLLDLLSDLSGSPPTGSPMDWRSQT